MDKLLKILLVVLPIVSPWDAVAKNATPTDYQAATIQAATVQNSSPTHSTHQSSAFAFDYPAEGEINLLNSLSYCNTLYDSQDNTFERAFVETSVQQYAAIYLYRAGAVAYGLITTKLIFPFHFFL